MPADGMRAAAEKELRHVLLGNLPHDTHLSVGGEARNRISASRLHEMAHILQVTVPFFFEGAPRTAGQSRRGGEAPSPAYVSEFLATADGLNLVKAFMQIDNAKVRHSLARLVEQIAEQDDH